MIINLKNLRRIQFTQKIDYNDSINMENFHNHHWEDKWTFAEKFRDSKIKIFCS